MRWTPWGAAQFFQLDRPVPVIVTKTRTGCDWADDEIVFVKAPLQLLNQLHAPFEGTTEILEPEIEPCLQRTWHVDGRSS